MFLKYWLLIIGVVTLALTGCNREPASPPPPTEAAPSPTSTIPAATPTPAAALTLPVLMGTPVPMPHEPITPENVDRIQQLAMWGRGNAKHAAFSPDGQTLAIGTTTGVWLHDAKTMELRRFMLTAEEVTAMDFLADGQLIAQVGGKTINRWDVTTGDLGDSWQIKVDFLEGVNFTPDGTQLAAPFKVSGAQIGVWDIQSGQLINTLKRQPRPGVVVSRLTFSPDGTLLALTTGPNLDTPQLSAEVNNAVEVRDSQTDALIHTLPLPGRGNLSKAVFSADGKLLAAASGMDIFVWQVETGELLHTLKGHTDSMLSLAFSPDGAQLASASYDKTVRLWSVTEGKPLHTLTGGDVVTSMKDLSFSLDGTTLVSVGVQSVVNLWDTATGTLLGEAEGYADGIANLAVASDGTLYTAHPHNLGVRQWNIQTGQITRHFPGQTVGGTTLAVSANGQILAASQYDPYPSILIWNAATGQLLQTLKENIQSVGSLTLSPDGSRIVFSEYTVYNYDTQTGQRLDFLKADQRVGKGKVTKLTFSPDGLKLAVNTQKVSLFEVKTGELLFALSEGASALSPDGAIIAVGDVEGQINLWSADTGELLRPLANQQNLVRALAFSPDGRLLASVQNDHAVYLWEVATGRLLRVLTGFPLVEGVMFLPDGKTLLSISPRDETVRFWGIPPQ